MQKHFTSNDLTSEFESYSFTSSSRDDVSFVPYLAVVSNERLSVHNLLDMSLKWEHFGEDVRFGTLASNSSRNRFAVGITSETSNEFVVAEFEPKSRVPIASSSTSLSRRKDLPSVTYFKGSRAPLCCVEPTGDLHCGSSWMYGRR